MTKFTITIESEQSEDVAYGALLLDLFMNGKDAKIQPFELKIFFDLFFSELTEYIWRRGDWNEEEARILTDILDKIVKDVSSTRTYAPWDGSVEP